MSEAVVCERFVLRLPDGLHDRTLQLFRSSDERETLLVDRDELPAEAETPAELLALRRCHARACIPGVRFTVEPQETTVDGLPAGWMEVEVRDDRVRYRERVLVFVLGDEYGLVTLGAPAKRGVLAERFEAVRRSIDCRGGGRGPTAGFTRRAACGFSLDVPGHLAPPRVHLLLSDDERFVLRLFERQEDAGEVLAALSGAELTLHDAGRARVWATASVLGDDAEVAWALVELDGEVVGWFHRRIRRTRSPQERPDWVVIARGITPRAA